MGERSPGMAGRSRLGARRGRAWTAACRSRWSHGVAGAGIVAAAAGADAADCCVAAQRRGRPVLLPLAGAGPWQRQAAPPRGGGPGLSRPADSDSALSPGWPPRWLLGGYSQRIRSDCDAKLNMCGPRAPLNAFNNNDPCHTHTHHRLTAAAAAALPEVAARLSERARFHQFLPPWLMAVLFVVLMGGNRQGKEG